MKKLLFAVLIVAISLMVLLPLSTVTHGSGKSKNSPRAETNSPKTNSAAKKDSVRDNRDAVALSSNAGEGEDPAVEDEGEDPDIPLFLQGRVDKAELLRLRGDQIAMIRGMQPDTDFDPTARGRAIEMMEQQQAAAAVLQADRFSKSVPSSINLQLLAPFSFPTWNELGPNPIPLAQTSGSRSNASGRVSAIEIDPVDPNKVYVGTAQGGVFRSLDGGVTWTPIFDNAQSLAIGSLSLDAARDWLWVGTGEANGSADSFAGVGLYRVENASSSAILVGPINPIRNYINGSGNPVSAGFFSGRSISKIVRVPNDPNTLYCGIAGGVIGLGGNPPLGNAVPPLGMRGLVRLSNVLGPPAGITGTRIAVSTTDVGLGLCAFDIPCTVNRNVNDLVLDPQDPSGNTLIVWLNGVNVAGDGGIYRSTNAMSGSPTFTQTLITTSTSTSNGRGELRAYARGGTTIVYAASGEPVGGGTLCTVTSQSGALRRSVDGGVTWSGKLPGGGGFCGGQCFYNIGFDVLPGAGTSTDKLLLGGNVSNTQTGGIACARQEATSVNGAATSFVAHDSITHADTHAIKFAPSDPNIVYRGDDGGIWKSTNGGDTWVPLNNTTFRATQFQSLALHPTDPDFTIGGTQDNGTERLTTGPVWIHSNDGDGGFTEIDQNAVNTTNVTMYHTFFNQAGTQIGYARTTTAGGSPGAWSFLGCSGTGTTRGITCTNTVNFYAPMAIGPGTPNTVYLGTDRLYRSADTGNSNQIVSQAPLVAGQPLSAIGIAKNDDNYRIVGLNNGALFFTTTGSTTLTNLDPTGGASTIPDFYVGRLVFDPNDKNTVYISLNGFAGGTAPSQSHVWRITNLNTTPVKTAINGSGANTLPDVPVNAFAVDTNDPSHAGVSVLYAGTDIGVYQSVDGGANWVPFGIGLPRVAVFDMGIPSGKRVLRIATHGRGMWEIEIPNCMMATQANVTVGNDPGQCGANVSYPDPSFTGSCGTITCLPASGSFFALGTTTVTCNSQANTSTSFTVTVNDTEAPTVTPISVTIPTLGPVNHEMINVGLAGGSFSDNCPGATRQILVFGNEDDETDTGDGNFSPDANNIDIGTLRLRSERIGGGKGRVYLIVVKVTDAAGNVSVTVATVVVPKSNSRSDVDAVNAQAAAARTFALSHAGAPPAGYFVIGDGPIIGPKQ